MMLSKPSPTSEQEQRSQQSEGLKPPTPLKKTPEAAVQDLERRLAMLSTSQQQQQEAAAPPAFAAPPPASASVAPSITSAGSGDSLNSAKGGKNALLARIMAAQERAKQTQAPPASAPAPATTTDFFSMTPQQQQVSDLFAPPPPSFDEVALPPPSMADAPPPAFDDMALPPPTEAPPPAPSAPYLAAPSAPTFEDLVSDAPSTTYSMASAPDQMTHVILPPPMEAPNSYTNAPPAAEEDPMAILAGLEGLSEEEKQALLQEQAKILADIEREKQDAKNAGALSAADRFEQRSYSAAVAGVGGSSRSASSQPHQVSVGSGQKVTLHDQERTRQAIAEGTALLVQCMSCQNWMQVTKAATLMFCPVCKTVSPVRESAGAANAINTAGMTDEEARQLQADMDLAEQLQKEEYKRAAGESDEARPRAATTPTRSSAASVSSSAAKSTSGQSWFEWLGLSSSTNSVATRSTTASTNAPSMSFAQPPSSASSPPSYETSMHHDLGMTHSSPSGARVAESQPLFSCVADSISVAANSISTAYNASQQDDEGNVHGVDASSLLVMSSAGRGSSGKDEASSPYQSMS